MKKFNTKYKIGDIVVHTTRLYHTIAKVLAIQIYLGVGSTVPNTFYKLETEREWVKEDELQNYE